MEMLLTVFVALVCAALMMNAVGALLLYLELRKASGQLESAQLELQEMVRAARMALEKAAPASDLLRERTARTRASLPESLATLGSLDNWARYGLAKADFNVERASDRLGGRMRRAANFVSEPLYRTATVIQGVKALLELLSRRREEHPRDIGPKSAA